MTFEDTLARLGMTIVNPEQNNHFNMLIHGVSGVGKTSLAATASQVDDMSPVLYVDFESGTLPVRDWGNPANITVVHCDKWVDCANLCDNIARNLAEFPYKTVVFDTLDKCQELILAHYEAVSNDTWTKWRAVYDSLLKAISVFLDSTDISFIAITHSARENNEVTGETFIAPSFEGQKSGQRIPALFNFVGYMEWANVDNGDGEEITVPVLYTRKPNVVTKQQSRGFPPAMGNPSMTKIHNYITSH